jgi:hypothetical protein
MEVLFPMIQANRLLFTLLLLCITPFTATAQLALSSLGFSDEQLAKLQQEGKVSNTGKSASALSLVPNAALKTHITQGVNTIKAKSVAESLHLIGNRKTVDQLRLYNQLSNLTALKGLQFYSRGDKKIKELISDAYFVDSFATKQRIDRPLATSLPYTWQGVMLQDDESFGAKYYDIFMYANASEIMMITQNLEKLSQGLITTAHVKEMFVVFYVIQTDAGLLIYQLMGMAQGIPGFVEKTAHESIFNRHEAFKNWIVANAPS